MKVSAEQITNGIIQYADDEVIRNLPTTGKWLVGTFIGIANTKVNNIVHTINDNAVIKAMGIVDENGMYDIDSITESMKCSATKYGKMSVNIPLVGMLTFSDADIDLLKRYIENSI